MTSAASLSRPALRKLAAAVGAKALLQRLYRHRHSLGARLEAPLLRAVNPKSHHFVPPDVAIEEFFRRLDDRGVRYVVLRWFENLPRLDRRHDLDILADDEHVDFVIGELTRWPVGHPVDLYSVSGSAAQRELDGAGSAAPLFPPSIARQILERRVRFRSLCAVPCPEDHFLALAYHAAFVKGPACGLPGRPGEPRASGPFSHDYGQALLRLAARAGIPLESEVTRDKLELLLASRGWAPSPAAEA